MRKALGLVHRWFGLVMALFLMLVGATGMCIAWFGELDRLAWPAIQSVQAPTPAAEPLTALALRQTVLQMHPGWTINQLELEASEPTSLPVSLALTPVSSGRNEPAIEQWFDPYTGQEVGRRHWGDLSEGRKNLMPFIYRLHESLALDTWGGHVLGIIALIWTIDCFVGAYLTLPRGRPFFKKWRISWQIKPQRFNFDLHRASGLWVWAMLFVMAWSSVGFNLREVYTPVMRTLFTYHDDWAELTDLPAPRVTPVLRFDAALDLGRQLASDESHRLGFRIERETRLMYNPEKGLYGYAVRSDRDVRSTGGSTVVWFDGQTGRLVRSSLPTGQFSGNTIASWLGSLHTAIVGGLPYRIFITVLGLIIVTLSVTGVIIWWRKRRARIGGRRFDRQAKFVTHP
ncbi:MAG: PepSY-associated TM helix domain-containing protein [Aquabacterium sp.]